MKDPDYMYNGKNAPVFSCEVFPPRTEASRESFPVEVSRLLRLPFQLLTCTNGACDSEPEGTFQTLAQLRECSEVRLGGHLCCRGATEEELSRDIDKFKAIGVDWVVALRGDRAGTDDENHFQHASELVTLLHRDHPELGVAVAGYPEVHPESESAESDLGFLRRKVDCGAHVIYTQFFFDNRDFFRFRAACRRVGVRVPIVPGILPIASLGHIDRLCNRCGAVVPDDLRALLENADDERQAGLEYTISQVVGLLEEGVEGLHFYCLNKADAVTQIINELKARLPHLMEGVYSRCEEQRAACRRERGRPVGENGTGSRLKLIFGSDRP